MDKNSLLNIRSKVTEQGFDSRLAIIISLTIELLHRNKMLDMHLSSSLIDDLICLEKENQSLNGISSYVQRYFKDFQTDSLNDIYVGLKRDSVFDTDESLDKVISNTFDIAADHQMNFSFIKETKFCSFISDWLCNGKSVKKAYIPYNNMFFCSAFISQKAGAAEVVNLSEERSVIDKLILALSGEHCSFKNQTFENTQEDNSTYDIGFSCPPLASGAIGNAKYGRAEEFVLDDMFTKVKGRFACIVLMRFAFDSRPKAKILREKFVNSGRLKAVIKLPAGFIPVAMVNMIALLFDEQGSDHKSVAMINLADDKFKDANLSVRRAFVLNDLAIETVKDALSGSVTSHCELTSVETISENEYSLDPGIYAFSDEIKQSLNALSQSTTRLDEIASFYRAQATKSDESGTTYLEVGAADINEYGFIKAPKKELTLASNSKCLKNKVEKGDIVFSIKGTVGKVAFIDRDVDNWLINQSFVIIKVTDKQWSPEYVFRCLKGKVVQDYISVNKIGSFIGSFPIDKLKAITLALPSKEDLVEAKEKTERQLYLLSKIDEIDTELRSLE